MIAAVYKFKNNTIDVIFEGIRIVSPGSNGRMGSPAPTSTRYGLQNLASLNTLLAQATWIQKLGIELKIGHDQKRYHLDGGIVSI
jgi:hypothetical protein